MFQVILFDLGRVVVGLGESPLPKQWLENEDILSPTAWFNSETGRLFERGEISSSLFIRTLKQELHLEQSEQEILEAFRDWPTGIYPGMPSVLNELRETHHLAVLSNTNDIHFPRLIDEFGIAEYFDTIFVSHHMHKAKPEPEAFMHVLDVLGVEPSKVLFLDDNIQNVEAAARMGIVSRHVCGEEQVIEALKEEALLVKD